MPKHIAINSDEYTAIYRYPFFSLHCQTYLTFAAEISFRSFCCILFARCKSAEKKLSTAPEREMKFAFLCHRVSARRQF